MEYNMFVFCIQIMFVYMQTFQPLFHDVHRFSTSDVLAAVLVCRYLVSRRGALIWILPQQAQDKVFGIFL